MWTRKSQKVTEQAKQNKSQLKSSTWQLYYKRPLDPTEKYIESSQMATKKFFSLMEFDVKSFQMEEKMSSSKMGT